MLKIKETTDWDVPNHTYYVDDSKTKLLGYINVLNSEETWFNGKRSFDCRNRTFEVISRLPDPMPVTAKTWQVEGSKGAVYTVTNDEGSWSCTCPAAAYQKGECKHIKSKIGALK